MKSASELFESAIAWLQANYTVYRFFVERDVVWTIQTYLRKTIEEVGLPYRVYNEYPMLPGNRRSLSADLAILNSDAQVEVAAEFKYEPSHARNDILPGKINPSVTFWTDIAKDVQRIQQFVALGKTRVAFSVFIDEGTFYRQRTPPSGSAWISWGSPNAARPGVAVLWARVDSNALIQQL